MQEVIDTMLPGASPGYILKDSGERQTFETGAVRDTQEGKGRYDLMSPIVNKRLAQIFEKGAKKYAARNWEKGMPLSRFIDSAKRHLDQFIEGHKDEDHLGQAIWNLCGLLHIQEMIARGVLDKSLDDLPNYLPKEKDYDQTKNQEAFATLPRVKRDEILLSNLESPWTNGRIHGLPFWKYSSEPGSNAGEWRYTDGFIYLNNVLYGYYVVSSGLSFLGCKTNESIKQKCETPIVNDFFRKPREERDKILLEQMDGQCNGKYLGVQIYLFSTEPKNSEYNTYNDGIIRYHPSGELHGYYVVKVED